MRTSAAYTPGPGVTRWFLTSRKRSVKGGPPDTRMNSLPVGQTDGPPTGTSGLEQPSEAHLAGHEAIIRPRESHRRPGSSRRRRGRPRAAGLPEPRRMVLALRLVELVPLPNGAAVSERPTDQSGGGRGARSPNWHRRLFGRLEEASWLALSARRSPRPRFGR